MKKLLLRSVFLLCALIVGSMSVWAEKKSITFTQTSTSAGTLDGFVPDGLSASFSTTYSNKNQLTSGNSMTLTLKGWTATTTIKGITLEVRNNKSTGDGSAIATIDSKTIGELSITGLGSNYQEKAMTIEPTLATDDLVITISATENSVYCQKFVIEYEEEAVQDLRTAVDIATFTAEQTTLLKGATTKTTVTNNADAWTPASYTYASDNEGVATVSPEGVITAVGKGTATITVTPNVAGEDANYKVGNSKSIEITVTNPTHKATFYVNGEKGSESDAEEGAAVVFPADPEAIEGKAFVGWVTEAIVGTTDDEPAFVTSATMGEADITYYAVFANVIQGTGKTKTDVLTTETFDSSSTYSDWSGKSVENGSGAVYAGNSATATKESAIQIRTKNNNSGIVTTTSGGKAKKITVVWSSLSTSGRTLDIYGKNTAYSQATDLYDSESKQGTKLGSIVYDTSTELTISGDYEYIGLRSNDGAMYLTSISIDWVTGTPDTYSGYSTTVVKDDLQDAGISFDEKQIEMTWGESFTGQALTNEHSVNVTYSSTDETVATVDASGVVTVLKAGTTTIKAIFAGDDNYRESSASYTLTINKAEAGLSFDETEFDLELNDVSFVAPTLNNPNNLAVEYTSSDENIAIVEGGEVVLDTSAEGSVTITASFAGNDNYEAGSAQYTITISDPNKKGTKNNPFTVAEAIAYIDEGENLTGQYVTGKISQIDSYSSGTITYWISDDGTTSSDQFEVYKGKGKDNASFTAKTDLEVGDVVVVYGNLQLYKTTYEFGSGNYLISRTEKPASDLTKTGDITLDFKNAETMADLTEYFTTSSTGALTYTVADDTVIESEEEIISALKEGTTTVTVSQEADLHYKAGEITINVTVQDSREAATTIPAINISTLKVGAPDGTISVVDPVKADAGVTFSFESDNEDVLLIDGTDYTVGSAGTATVTVTATASDSKLYKDVVKTFDVTVEVAVKSDNAIVLDGGNSGSVVYGTPKVIDYEVETGYEGELEYIIDNDAIADVVIGDATITFTPKAVGTAVITLSAPATTTFNAADDVEYTLTVTAPEGETTAATATVTTTFTDKDLNYSGTGIDWAASISANSFESANTSRGVQFGTAKGEFTLTAENTATITNVSMVVSTNGEAGKNTISVKVGDTSFTTVVDNEDVETFDMPKENNQTVEFTGNASGNVVISINDAIKSVYFKSITLTKGANIQVKLNASGYATYCSQYPLDFTDAEAKGYSAWQITDINESAITFAQVKGQVKGGTGLLLKGEAGATITLASADSNVTLDNNMLEGLLAPTYVAAEEYYGLSGKTFVKVNAGTVPSGKALLPAAYIPSNARQLNFVFITDESTAIKGIEAMKNGSEGVYNLNGQRVSQPSKGMYIMSGKKVFVK